MTQEIYDYLSSRTFLIVASSSELIDSITNEEEFQQLISDIANLMQKEDFLLIYPEAIDNIADLLFKYRFKYNKNKSINDDINYIIERINEYRHMSKSRKDYLVKEFCQNEYKKRSLPLCYSYFDQLKVLIALDYYSFLNVGKIAFSNETGQYEQVDEITLTGIEFLSYLSVINMLINTSPSTLIDNNLIDINIQTISNIIDVGKVIPKHQLNYAKKTIKNLKKLEKGNIKIKRLEY